jgi:hypothetical protein
LKASVAAQSVWLSPCALAAAWVLAVFSKFSELHFSLPTGVPLIMQVARFDLDIT